MKTVSAIYSVLSITIALVSTTSAYAQSYSSGLKREVEDVEALYPKRTRAVNTASSEVQINSQTVQPAAAAPSGGAQPIYIIQQPTTNVDAAPVKESRAEVLRKQREEVERQNEMKLIEKLEDDRLNAEKTRMDQLNGGAAAVAAPVQTTTTTTVQQPQFVEQSGVAKPIPVIVVNQPAQNENNVAEAIVAAKVIDAAVKKDESKFILGPILGITNYPSISNVSGVYSIGASGEWLFSDNKFSVSGDVIYSSFDIRNVTVAPCYYCIPVPGTPIITTMNQWNAGSTLKYRFGEGTLKPFVGTYVGYTRRGYSARVSWAYNNDSYTGSNAFDGGLLAGVAIKASDSIVFGAEFRYIWNFSYRTDDPLAYGVSGYTYIIGAPLESLNYYTASVNMRIIL